MFQIISEGIGACCAVVTKTATFAVLVLTFVLLILLAFSGFLASKVGLGWEGMGIGPGWGENRTSVRGGIRLSHGEHRTVELWALANGLRHGWLTWVPGGV